MKSAWLKSLVLVSCLCVGQMVINYYYTEKQLTRISSQLDNEITNQLEEIKKHEQSLTNSLENINNLTKQLEQKLTELDNLQRQLEQLSVKTDIPVDLQTYITNKAYNNNYRPELLLGIIQNESKWNPKAKSDTNDHGLCQINEINFKYYQSDIVNKYGYFDPYNPYISVDMMVETLNNFKQYFYNSYGYYPNEECLLFAYNTGKLKDTFKGNTYTTKVLGYTEQYKTMLSIQDQIANL